MAVKQGSVGSSVRSSTPTLFALPGVKYTTRPAATTPVYLNLPVSAKVGIHTAHQPHTPPSVGERTPEFAHEVGEGEGV